MFTPGVAQNYLPDQQPEHEAGRAGDRERDAAQREALYFAKSEPATGGGQW